MPTQPIQPMQQLHCAAYHFADDGAMPNHPTLPMLVYQGVFRPDARDPAVTAEAILTANGWEGTWRNGIFDYHHYHSTAHEVLAICRGHAEVRFGGEQGITLRVGAGDVVVLPAGTGHKRLSSSHDLLVVGAYPPGQRPDLRRGVPGERPAVMENIRRVPLPALDPIYGKGGPLLDYWKEIRGG
jgi:uncharacterized protein YjlB